MVSSVELHRANNGTITSAYLLLVEFWELGDEATKQYAVINNEDVVSNGVTYYKSGISVNSPSSKQGKSINISVSNINRAMGRAVLSTKQPIVCRVMEINMADPDVILKDTHDLFMLSGATVTAETVAGDLAVRWSNQEPFPNEGISDLFFPGL